MSRKSKAGNVLDTFFQDVGVPTRLHMDGSKEVMIGKWKEIDAKVGGCCKQQQNLVVLGRVC
jgi:hypothetical protein